LHDTKKLDFSKNPSLETLTIEAGEGNMSEMLLSGNLIVKPNLKELTVDLDEFRFEDESDKIYSMVGNCMKMGCKNMIIAYNGDLTAAATHFIKENSPDFENPFEAY
jgi:hypothetical protein